MSRVILHSDCNSFYASVECALNPKLKNYPVAVSGNAEERHGIILTKNQIAKKYNIKTGEAIWQAKKKCPQLIVLQADFPKYLEFSKYIKDLYNEYTDSVESFGIDEAWLDVTGSRRIFGSGKIIAEKIRSRVKKELGITVSIGVSFNKIFAKLGSDYKKPDAITVISEENYKDIVWPLPAEDLLYVGRSTIKKLHGLGVYTIGDAANIPENILVSNLGKWGYLLHSFANGQDTSAVSKSNAISAVKSIGNSMTAVRDLKNDDDVKIILSVLCDSVGQRLREQGMKCSTVAIQIRDKYLYSFTRQTILKSFSNITQELFCCAFALFKKNYGWQNDIRSIGISLSGLVSADNAVQISLFSDETKRVRLENLNLAGDKIKNKYGSKALVFANVLADKKLSSFCPKDEHKIYPVSYF